MDPVPDLIHIILLEVLGIEPTTSWSVVRHADRWTIDAVIIIIIIIIIITKNLQNITFIFSLFKIENIPNALSTQDYNISGTFILMTYNRVKAYRDIKS